MTSKVENPYWPIEVISEQQALQQGMLSVGGLSGVTTTYSGKVYKIITDMVVKTIEENPDLVWRRPWSSKGGGRPKNFDSKKPYRGVNSLMLLIESILRGLTNPYWMTAKQIQNRKGKIKKGAKTGMVCFYLKTYTEYATGKKITEEQARSLPPDKYFQQSALMFYKVFNGEDIEGIDWQLPERPGYTPHEQITHCESIVQGMPNVPKITFDDGEKAFYSPSQDSVTVPRIGWFDSAPKHYSVLFHELVHSTLHESRLNRKSINNHLKNQKAEYAFEELIAELGSTFLCGESGILYHTIKNSAAYLSGWKAELVTHMKEDSHFLFKAATQAETASDYILKGFRQGLDTNTEQPGTPSPITEPVKKRTRKAREPKPAPNPQEDQKPLKQKARARVRARIRILELEQGN